MADESLSRGQRLLALILDWVIVLGVIFGSLDLIGVPGMMNVVILALLVLVIVLIPIAYFLPLKWATGTTLGRVIVIGLRRLYRWVQTGDPTQ